MVDMGVDQTPEEICAEQRSEHKCDEDHENTRDTDRR
jgi:hypothetical protein